MGLCEQRWGVADVSTVRSSRIVPTIVAASTAATAAVLVWGEWVHWSADRREAHLPVGPTLAAPPDPAGPRIAVLVLGFGNLGQQPNLVNRWRARLAVRTARDVERRGGSATIVCSGGPVRGPISEARHLRSAVRQSGWDGPVSIEESSRATWQNIENTRTLLEDFDGIAICSNGLHAEKARVYLARQDEHLARRLVRTKCYRLGEMTFVKPVFAAFGLRKLRALRS